MTYVVVNWYTPSYAGVAARFKASLLATNPGVEHQAYEVDDQGGWAQNVLVKPYVLRKAFADYPKHHIVYIDSDAIIHGPLTLFDQWPGEDFGAHYLRGSELLGGTQWWSNTPKMHGLVDVMAEIMEDRRIPREQRTSQRVLQRILPDHPEISVRRLPPEYCCIFDISRALHPGVAPVVEHMQESRRQRK